MLWLPFVSWCLVLQDGSRRCSTEDNAQVKWQSGTGRNAFNAFGKNGAELHLHKHQHAQLEVELLSADTDLAVKLVGPADSRVLEATDAGPCGEPTPTCKSFPMGGTYTPARHTLQLLTSAYSPNYKHKKHEERRKELVGRQEIIKKHIVL